MKQLPRLRAPSFRSHLHDERVAALLGISLGSAFAVCFLTGVLSHLIQHPPGWFEWPPRPAGLYRVTQGLHVATGIASVPLLLAKLWTVYPRLWRRPPFDNLAHALERISLVPLVAGSLFLLFTGVADIGLWYPWRFFFPAGHYWASWITIGALIVHVGAKAPVIRRALGRANPPPSVAEGLSRRGFLGAVGAAVGLLTLTTLGQTFAPLKHVALLAPRRPDIGPQGFPVNKSAYSARVTERARSASYALRVEGRVERELVLSLADLRQWDQRETMLPISCVEGWSADVRWRGVPVAALLALAGAPGDASVQVESLQGDGLYRISRLNRAQSRDPDTLLALECNGEPLHIDHGYPLRLIGPNRPGVQQTKWVSMLRVT